MLGQGGDGGVVQAPAYIELDVLRRAGTCPRHRPRYAPDGEGRDVISGLREGLSHG